MIQLTPYNLVYLLSQILGVYAAYKIMVGFFNNRKVEKITSAIYFLGYYILTCYLYLFVNIPLINFIATLLGYWGLTFLFESSIRKKIFVSLLTYIFGFCSEMIVVTLTGYINFPIDETNNYDSIFGVVAANVLFFIISMFINGFKSIKKGDKLPKVYWTVLIAVPFSLLYLLVVFFQITGLSAYEISSAVLAILMINFMVFFLFDRVSMLYKEQQESALIKQQNEYYVNQLLLSEETHQKTMRIRHDIKNHLLTIDSFLDKGHIAEAKKHITNIIGVYQNTAEIIHTGFPEIDGLLNAKLQPAKESDVDINIKVSLPSDFNFSSFDLTVILGNLVDNALQAVYLVEKDRFIDFRMDCSKGIFIIKISNPFSTEIKMKNGEIITSKEDKENHGFGLKNVIEILEKYNGTLETDTQNGIFTTTTALYID